jgi:hypothetical protein
MAMAMAATPRRQKATADATRLYHHTPAEFRRKLIQLVRAYSTLIQRPGWGRGMSIKRAAPDRRASIRTLSSNSLAIRSSPHDRFSVAMRRINCRSSSGIGRRPGRRFRRDTNLHPARCHRSSVSGRTMVSAQREIKQLESKTRLILVAASVRHRLIPRSL